MAARNIHQRALRWVRHARRVLCLLFPAATLMVTAAACARNSPPPAVTAPPAPVQTQHGTSAPMHVDPALKSFVDRAVADLSRRRDADPAQVRVLEARAVVWPDGSLGCPQPGMEYTQALQEGVLIRLESGGRTYAYHGGGSRMPELCENPAAVPPI